MSKTYLLITNPDEFGEEFTSLRKLKAAIAANKTGYCDVMEFDGTPDDTLADYRGTLDPITLKAKGY